MRHPTPQPRSGLNYYVVLEGKEVSCGQKIRIMTKAKFEGLTKEAPRRRAGGEKLGIFPH